VISNLSIGNQFVKPPSDTLLRCYLLTSDFLSGMLLVSEDSPSGIFVGFQRIIMFILMISSVNEMRRVNTI
jgi:hypothetical protein